MEHSQKKVEQNAFSKNINNIINQLKEFNNSLRNEVIPNNSTLVFGYENIENKKQQENYLS